MAKYFSPLPARRCPIRSSLANSSLQTLSLATSCYKGQIGEQGFDSATVKVALDNDRMHFEAAVVPDDSLALREVLNLDALSQDRYKKIPSARLV